MAAAVPLWRKVFDVSEEFVRVRVDPLVRTEGFADVLTLVAQLQVEARRRTERLSRRLLHSVNLPTASDTRRLQEQLGAIERRLRDLSKVVNDLGVEPDRSQSHGDQTSP
jgi:hypothetical protein